MTDEPAAFPWDAVLHAGLCRMRLSPRDFWRMTPRELFAVLGGLVQRGGAPDRASLMRLIRDFPDERQPGGNG